MMFFLFVILLPVVIFAVAYSQCFWTNFLNCIMVVLSSAMAFNYAQAIANLLNEKAPDWAGFTEFVIMWLIFVATFLVLKSVANILSKFPVRMGKDVDHIFDWVGCALLTIVMYGWICFSFFSAPVGEEGFVAMMRGGIPSSVGQAYGYVVVQLPSTLGMGGHQFETVKYAQTRIQRAEDEANHAEN